MAQHDGVIDNGTGSAVRTDINNALAAINSNNSGGSDPSTTYAYQFYADTGDNTLKIRNAANDGFVNVSITGGIGTENFGLAPLSGGTFTGDVTFTSNIILDNQADIRFEEATANGSNYIALQAPAAIASNVTLTLPAVAPTAGQALLADSSTPTTLTWGSAAGVGGATGVDFNDNVKIRFGTGNDFEFYHNGTDSYIDNNTGHIFIRNNVDNDDGGNIYIQAKSGENSILIQDDSSVTLYFDNTSRLATADGGVVINGVLNTNGNDVYTENGAFIADDLDGAYADRTGANIDHIWHDDSANAWNFVSDAGYKVTGNSTLKAANLTLTGGISGVGAGKSVCVLREKLSHAANAGTFTSGADRVRVLNTEEHDGESFCTLNTSTGEFDLPAGTYLIYFAATAFDVNNHRAKIVTDGGTDKIFANNIRCAAGDATQNASVGFGVVTNASAEGYFLKHRCSTTKTTSGFGQDADFASEEEFYATVVIWRMDN